MYKLLIVEDEDYIRETIVSCIDWQGIGFQVEQAEDGERALEVADWFLPDAVVTDVRMPIMDGLELTANIKTRYPNTVVVVLSGHDEFRYAQEAMNLGVLEYITKPILPKNFTLAMQRLHTRLQKDHKQRTELEILGTQLHKSLPLLRERLLNWLVTQPLDLKLIEQRLGILELDTAADAYAVLLFSAYEKESTSVQVKELIAFALLNVISEEIGNRGICFNDSVGRLVVIFRILDTENEDRAFILELAGALRQSNQYVLDFTITAAIGATVSGLDELHFSYETATMALEQQLLLGRDNTFDYRDFVQLELIDYNFFAQVEELISCFRFKETSDFLRKLDELTLTMKKQSGNPDSIRVALTDLLSGIHRVLLEAGCPLPSDGLVMYEQIFSMNHLDELIPCLIQYISDSKTALSGMSVTRSALLIQMVCQYIKQNYSDPTLSLNKTAAHVYISSVYLSTIFKRELGLTFVDYVTTTRLEQAKNLLEGSVSKNYEVATLVGYNDPQYFSNCFKKYTGMTPSEYRTKRR